MNFRQKIQVIVTIFGLMNAGLAQSESLYVIAHPGLTIDPAEIKDIFQGETQFSGSTNLTPTDNTTAQALFLGKVMGINMDKYTSIWVKKTFRDGINQPSALNTDEGVIEFVKKTPGGIGYIISPPAGVDMIKQY